MWWVDQKIVNGDKQKNKTQSEFSCIFKVFVAIPRDIVNYYYTTIYILTSKSSLQNFSIKAPSVRWEKNYSGNIFWGNKTFLFVKIDSWNFQRLFDLGFRGQDSSFLSQQMAPWWRNFWVKILTYIIHIVSEERIFFLKVFADYSMPLLDNYNKKRQSTR